MLKDMDEKDEMKTLSSSEGESDETDDEEVEYERRLQRALLEKDKVSLRLSGNHWLNIIIFKTIIYIVCILPY